MTPLEEMDAIIATNEAKDPAFYRDPNSPVPPPLVLGRIVLPEVNPDYIARSPRSFASTSSFSGYLRRSFGSTSAVALPEPLVEQRDLADFIK